MQNPCKSWQFDQHISEIFPSHARQHIPHYDHVIDLCVQVASLKSKTTKIIDVGCAVGETLRRLHQLGFTNLYGVDNSADMLQKCPNYAELILSNNFPVEHAPFDLIFCNWTLHFVQHKISYLRDCFNSLNDNGYMVLSEKTSLDNLPIHFYHEFKRSQGVSQTEITQKEQSLVGVMHINSPEWYIQTLRSLGFKKVWIIDAYWCFTTFLVEK